MNSKFFILLLLSIITLSAKSLDIYIVDSKYPKGYKKVTELFKEKSINNDLIILKSNDGKIFYRGTNKNFITYLKKSYRKNIEYNNFPYTLHSIYATILPVHSNYDNINLYFINAIFYKDKKSDFAKGFPNAPFLTKNSSPFANINDFKGFSNLKSYIFTKDDYFINQEHFNGLKRFYVQLFNKYHLNLQTFNNTFSTKKENLSVKKYEDIESNQALKVGLTPPKKLHYSKDSIHIIHNPNNGTLEGYIKNPDRKNSYLTLKLNDEIYNFKCDEKGVCKIKLNLSLGKNILTFKQIDNSIYKQEFNSKYIPDDIIDYKILDDNGKLYFILKSKKTYRPIGSEVVLVYEEKHKEFKTKVDESGYYEFKIPMEFIYNTYILKQYNGNKIKISVENKVLKKKKEEERRKKLEEAKRAEERKRLEEEKRKAEEEARKKGLVKIDSINNKAGYKGASGDPRINIKWNSNSDIDLYVTDPCGNEIPLGGKKECRGHMGYHDVDANYQIIVPNPQENVTWKNGGVKGKYKIKIHVFKVRSNDIGKYIPVILTIVNDGQTYQKRVLVKSGEDFEMDFTHRRGE